MLIFDYTDISVSVILNFNPGHAQLVRPQRFPNQRRHVAESGRLYVYQRSSNKEMLLPIDFIDLPENDVSVQFTTSGYLSLKSFLEDTVNWSEKAFTLTDPDGDVYTVKYWGGFESLEEAAGRTSRARYWSGTLLVREVI